MFMDDREAVAKNGPAIAESTPPSLAARYARVRALTARLCAPLEVEDYVIQAMPDVSPTKWHLAHTTWFFETFVLQAACRGYRPFHPQYAYLFNSYYVQAGDRWSRPHRGLLSRPTVAEVHRYRQYVDEAMGAFLESSDAGAVADVVEIGLNHEQQHQELMLTDLKYNLWVNPLRPAYREDLTGGADGRSAEGLGWLRFPESIREIGYGGDGFFYDNEGPRHRELVHGFELADRLITNGEYREFMDDGGYQRAELWLSEGWNTVQAERWQAPLYWEREDGREWESFTLAGMRKLDPEEPVTHVSYYEADAYARWRGASLPTEAQWETACEGLSLDGNFVESDRLHPAPAREAATAGEGVRQMLGDAWEWTASPYVAYPGYRPAEGALGEYNGKFMCNQMVLRGGSCATSITHIRPTYRNFFPPSARWQFSGIRLAKPLA